MRPKPLSDSLRPPEELVASFGGPTITRSLDRQFHIWDGTEEGRAQARAWMDRRSQPNAISGEGWSPVKPPNTP